MKRKVGPDYQGPWAGECEHDDECECDLVLPTKPLVTPPKIFFLAKESLHDYADKTEPTNYPGKYVELVLKSDYDKLLEKTSK